MAAFGPDNLKGTNTTGNGLGPVTKILSLVKGTGDHTQAELDSVLTKLTAGVPNSSDPKINDFDAVTVVGIAGTIGTDPVHIAVQGSGRIGTSAGDYGTDLTVAVVATFDQG